MLKKCFHRNYKKVFECRSKEYYCLELNKNSDLMLAFSFLPWIDLTKHEKL